MQMRYEDTPKKVPESVNHARVIDFQPQWIEPQNGLPIYVADWVRDNMRPDERVTGIRMVEGQGFPFYIQRDSGHLLFENSKSFFFIAVFDSPSDDNTSKTIEVAPGQILYRQGNGTVYRRFIEVIHSGGPNAWRLDFETRRIYERTDEYCPRILEHAFHFIDNLVFDHTGVKTTRVSTFIGMLGPGAGLRDPKACKLTPPEMVSVFMMIRDMIRMWNARMTQEGQGSLPTPEERVRILKEMARRLILKLPVNEPIHLQPDRVFHYYNWQPESHED